MGMRWKKLVVVTSKTSGTEIQGTMKEDVCVKKCKIANM